VALARKHGVKVYSSLDDPRVKDDLAKQMRATSETYRARAAQAWAAGVDGICLFNFFEPDSRILHELGDPKLLGKLDQDYFASFLGAINSSNGNYPTKPFIKLELLDAVNFKALMPGKSVTTRLNVGEDFAKSGPVKLKLRLRFSAATDPIS